MSRSKRKTPKLGITKAETEKAEKRKANRKFRRVTKTQLNKNDEELPRTTKAVSDVWSFKKDGKQYLKNPSRKDLRK